MKYTQATFTLPASGNRTTQENWDRAFAPADPSPEEAPPCKRCRNKGYIAVTDVEDVRRMARVPCPDCAKAVAETQTEEFELFLRTAARSELVKYIRSLEGGR